MTTPNETKMPIVMSETAAEQMAEAQGFVPNDTQEPTITATEAAELQRAAALRGMTYVMENPVFFLTEAQTDLVAEWFPLPEASG